MEQTSSEPLDPLSHEEFLHMSNFMRWEANTLMNKIQSKEADAEKERKLEERYKIAFVLEQQWIDLEKNKFELKRMKIHGLNVLY
uniref:Uncharacterized protein n=1 Tax=Oryza meridionalis TaxID=40149 RepID=A0A0E0E4J1_9ORYZ